MYIGATNSDGTKKPMYHYVEVTNDITELLENILKEDLETTRFYTWNSWLWNDWWRWSYYGLTYMFHDTADYHDNVDELLVKLENGITITGFGVRITSTTLTNNLRKQKEFFPQLELK